MRGADKLLEPVDGVPLIRRQAAMARAVTSGAVIVALPQAPHPRHAALEGLDVVLLPVPDADEGMNATLRAAFAALPYKSPAAMLLLGDLPELTAQDLQAVMHAVDLRSKDLVWRGATQDGRPGHPVVFAAALFPEIAKLTGDSGGREVVQAARGLVRLIPLPGLRARRDLDTPEEWAAWRSEKTERQT